MPAELRGLDVSEPKKPWERPKAGSDPLQRQNRMFVFVLVLLVGGALLAVMSKLFPVSDKEDWSYALRGLAIAAMVSASLAARRTPWRDSLRDALIWTAIVAVLWVGYVFKDDAKELGLRMVSSIAPSVPMASANGDLTISQSSDGSYYISGAVNGQPVTFLVDTGASDVVLTQEDARRAGIDVGALTYSRASSTANGIGRDSPVTVSSLEVSGVRLLEFPVVVNKAPMPNSLLGMSYLRRLKSFRFDHNRLILQK